MAPYLRSARRRLICWSLLPSEILDLILQRLSFPDCFIFGGVCSSWRRVLLASKLCCPARPPPMLVLFVTDYVKRKDTTTCNILSGFFNDVSKGPLKLRFSRSIFLPYDRIVGSFSEWLVVASDRKSGLRLLNPISHQQILLPSTTSDGTRIWCKRSGTTCFAVAYVALSSSPTNGDCVLVAHGYVLNNGRLAYLRLGRDREWTTFTEPRIRAWENMTFHNGELIIIGYNTNHDSNSILVFTFNPHPNLKAFYMAPMSILACTDRWLVSSGAELLLVRRLHNYINVYKLGPDGWDVVESLGDRALLLGKKAAESFCTRGLMGTGFEPNCIYYRKGDRLTKFSMADGSMKTVVIHHRDEGDHESWYFLEFEWIVTHV